MKFLHALVLLSLGGSCLFQAPGLAGKGHFSLSMESKHTPDIPVFSSKHPVLKQRFYPQLGRRSYISFNSERFLDPMNSFAFQKLFATEEHEPLLIHFLNSLLHLKGDQTIQKVEFLLGREAPRSKILKWSDLNIKCTNNENFEYVVAVQNKIIPNFIHGPQNYIAGGYVGQLELATPGITIKPVVLLTITNCELFPDQPADYISFHQAAGSQTERHDLQDMSFAFVELSKFTKTLEDSKTPEDQWLYFFKNHNVTKAIPKNLPPEIEKAYDTLEQFNWTQMGKEAFFKANMNWMDEWSAIHGAFEEGKQRGLEEARAKIAAQDERCVKEEVARKLLHSGMDPDTVADLTGLSVQELKGLPKI